MKFLMKEKQLDLFPAPQPAEEDEKAVSAVESPLAKQGKPGARKVDLEKKDAARSQDKQHKPWTYIEATAEKNDDDDKN